MAEKKEVKHRIDQMELENEKTLDILTKQLHDKFSILEDKIKQTSKQNETLQTTTILENEFRSMNETYTLLKRTHEVLQQRFNLQESEITTLRNKSVALEKKVSVIEHLKTINQSLSLHNVQNEVQELKQTTSLLTNNQNARNQDFLALYNMTLTSDKNVQEQFFQLERHQNLTFGNVISQIKNNSKQMDNQLDMLTHNINASLTTAFSNMNMLRSQIGDNIALTACTVSTKVINGAVPFPKIYTSVGITNQATFLSTGKFVCDIPGLYYISSYIRTNQNEFVYYLMKNNVPISKSATTYWSGSIGYSTSVITTAVDIQSNDELYLKSPVPIVSKAAIRV
ncbi:COL10A [Mytilus edulis]|uniref:COL10A n=1 Tax=Mytilus edulis TaxID=6550 RepID=A0A8S3SBS5_MYTED|nr:COL10A [Mytilus edulis]